MKKTLFSIFVSVLLLSYSLLLVSCSPSENTFSEISDNYENLAKKAVFSEKTVVDGGKITINFGKTVTFNRLVLKEKTENVTSFTLSLPERPSPFYGNDFIGKYRYCSFPAVTTDKIEISVTSDGKATLSEIEAYYIPDIEKPFSITSYITAKGAYSMTQENEIYVDVFDIIYSAYLTKDGEVYFPDYFIDDKRIDGKEMFSSCIRNIRSSCPKARITATVLGDRDFKNDGLTLQQRCSSAFSQKENLSSSLLSIFEKYNLDGISFDYEYPLSRSDYTLFTDFCAYFRQKMPQDKLLSAAVSAWCVDKKRLSASSLSCFDRIILMAYDDNDRACHSTFYTAYSQLKRLKAQGVPLGRILLGIPLYAKPLDGSAFAVTYSDHADSIPIYSNTVYAYCDDEYKPCYLNGRQMIADKTSLSLDIGLRGIAAWHYSLDSKDPALSLLATARRTAFPDDHVEKRDNTQIKNIP